jgi:hypothetical protein
VQALSLRLQNANVDDVMMDPLSMLDVERLSVRRGCQCVPSKRAAVVVREGR